MNWWSSVLAGVAVALGPTTLSATDVKIVGLGAATCSIFREDIDRRPDMERLYFAWAQGYMNGIMIRAPEAQEEAIDLTRPDFPLQAQLAFLRSFCTDNPTANYADAIQGLYLALQRRR